MSSRAGFLSTCALSLIVSMWPAAAAPVNAGQSESVARSAVRIANFGRIDAHYYRGSQPEGRDYADLAAIGVKTIINLTSDDAQPNEKALTEQAGMSYVQIPMTMHRAPTEAQLAE